MLFLANIIAFVHPILFVSFPYCSGGAVSDCCFLLSNREGRIFSSCRDDALYSSFCWIGQLARRRKLLLFGTQARCRYIAQCSWALAALYYSPCFHRNFDFWNVVSALSDLAFHQKSAFTMICEMYRLLHTTQFFRMFLS